MNNISTYYACQSLFLSSGYKEDDRSSTLSAKLWGYGISAQFKLGNVEYRRLKRNKPKDTLGDKCPAIRKER